MMTHIVTQVLSIFLMAIVGFGFVNVWFDEVRIRDHVRYARLISFLAFVGSGSIVALTTQYGPTSLRWTLPALLLPSVVWFSGYMLAGFPVLRQDLHRVSKLTSLIVLVLVTAESLQWLGGIQGGSLRSVLLLLFGYLVVWVAPIVNAMVLSENHAREATWP